MSDTPRTDAAVKEGQDYWGEYVDPDFARQLERELWAATSTAKMFQALIEGHNADCAKACEATAEGWCPASTLEMTCPDCPKAWIIESPLYGPSTGESASVSRQHAEGPPNAAPQVPVDRKSGQQQDVNTSLPADAAPHRWDADGEMCERCGDKDWFAGPVCKGPM